jgi:two-component system sensor histidine kinase/response regulator
MHWLRLKCFPHEWSKAINFLPTSAPFSWRGRRRALPRQGRAAARSDAPLPPLSANVDMTTSTAETNTGCLLVVDDVESNIQIIGAALGKLGYEILPARSGAQALQRLVARQPDLILLDLLMPEMDGFEVCRRIRENPHWREIPIIFLSSADDKDLIVRALESGGVDYITKPFNCAELTVRVRTQLELKIARDSLKQIAEDRDEMLGILTHDLKGHLGGMHMSAQILCERAEKLEDSKLRLMAENISFSSGQMLAFVREFLANASADYGLKIHLESVDLAAAASRAVEPHRQVAKRKQITLQTAWPESGAHVQADLAALNQVLDNLLSNAIKFSPAEKQISVTVLSSAGHCELRIQDQGPGFTAEDKVRMFRRYARLSARPTGGEPSTGLGLSITRKLVLAIHGELTCDSTPGHGATFTLRLPRATPNCEAFQ